MKAMTVIALTLALGACATPYKDPKAYWTRPAGTLPQLAEESEACYRASLETDAPSALPRDSTGPRLLPRTEPPYQPRLRPASTLTADSPAEASPAQPHAATSSTPPPVTAELHTR